MDDRLNKKQGGKPSNAELIAERKAIRDLLDVAPGVPTLVALEAVIAQRDQLRTEIKTLAHSTGAGPTAPPFPFVLPPGPLPDTLFQPGGITMMPGPGATATPVGPLPEVLAIMFHYCKLSEERPEQERAFMVRLSPGPAMPGPRWSGSSEFTVHACRPPYLDPEFGGIDGWSWINLSRQEKECVGVELLKLATPEGTPWVWCLLYLELNKNDGRQTK